MEDEVIIQWALNFGSGGWKYISPRIGNKSDEYYCSRYDKLCAEHKNIGLIERSLAEKLYSEAKLYVKDGSGKDANFEVFLETESGMLWKQLMIKLYRRFKIFGKESMTDIEFENVSYYISNYLDDENNSDNLSPSNLRQVSQHFNAAVELIDSSIIDAIDGTMSFEQNSPFPSNIKVLTMQDYQRLLHSLYLKRPSPDSAFSHTPHFNAKRHLQNRVIHISKPIGNSSTKRRFDYPLLNTPMGIVPLSFVQTPVETAQLRCCGFVSVPLYELVSATPIQLQLPEPLQLRLQRQDLSASNEREPRRTQKEREQGGSEGKERQTKQTEAEKTGNAKQGEKTGSTLGAENKAAASGEEMQKQKQERTQE